MNDSNGNFFIYYGAIPGSPAEKFGLQIGDKILSVNGMPLLNLEDLNAAIENEQSKRIVEVLRNNKLLSIEIDMTEYFQNQRENISN